MTNTNELSLLPEWRTLWKRRWWLLGAAATGIALGLILSLPSINPREYKATASFIPPGLDYVQNFRGRRGLSYPELGTATPRDLEQVLSLMEADTLRRRVQRRFDLPSAYRIKGSGPGAAQALDIAYRKHISVIVGSNSTIEVAVYDEQPTRAAAIANYLLAAADSLIEGMTGRTRALDGLSETARQLRSRRQVLLDSLAYLRGTYGLFNLTDLSDASASLATRRLLQPQHLRYYDLLIAYEQELGGVNDQLLQTEALRSSLRENLAEFPSLLVQRVPAAVPQYPSRPRRLFLVAGSLLAALAFAVLAILVLDRARH